MRRLSFIFALLLPVCAFAQKDAENLDKYLSGAVPEVDGKVVFSKDYSVPSLSENEVYNRSLKWVDGVLANNQSSRVLIADQEKGSVVAMNERYMVFKSSFITIDRATVSYLIDMKTSAGAATISVKRIKYLYNDANGKPARLDAEEWITDKNALNKSKTKMFPGTKKFRMKTVDMVDSLFTSYQNALGAIVAEKSEASSGANAATQTTATQETSANTGIAAATGTTATITASQSTTSSQSTVMATTEAQTAASAQATVMATTASQTATTQTATSQTQMPGYKKIAPEDIPGNFIKMVSKDWMLVTAGNDEKFNTMTASWGGIGVLYNKPVAICFINPARYTYKFMEEGDVYTLTFYTENYRKALEYCGTVSGRDTDKIKGSGLTPITLPEGGKAFSEAWMIIECRKFVSQSISLDGIDNDTVKEQWSTKPMHKMYIGEIVNVFVK